MRIIAGEFKGRRLLSFQADHIRPTTDRVKESVFNILQAYWDDAQVLDLFSGTGNLTIESLSRGAKQVVAVESHPKSLEIIRKNIEEFKVGKRVKIVKQDVIQFLQTYSGGTFDVILIDPPFTEKMAHDVMEALSRSKCWLRETIIMIEYSKFEKMEMRYGDLAQIDSRSFGDKLVAFFQAQTAGET